MAQRPDGRTEIQPEYLMNIIAKQTLRINLLEDTVNMLQQQKVALDAEVQKLKTKPEAPKEPPKPAEDVNG